MRSIICVLFVVLLMACGGRSPDAKADKVFATKGDPTVPIIRLDRAAISGVGLRPVQNHDQPERRLFQKRLVRGDVLSVYVVSSETATAQHQNYGMEEFIHLVNGRSRMDPVNGEEVIFETGDSFIAPKGFTGEWETIGGDEFLIELSIITTNRVEIDSTNQLKGTLPYQIDRGLRSGIGTSPVTDGKCRNVVYTGVELTVTLEGNEAGSSCHIENSAEQVVEVLSGKVTVISGDGTEEIFVGGDYFMIPSGFAGQFMYEGHGLVRTMHIYASKLSSTILQHSNK